jgi:hypothetical protein
VGGDTADAIVSFVRANDGQGVREIAAGVGISVPVAKKAAVQLLASGALKKSGVRRGTKYHVGSGQPARVKKKATRKAKRKSTKRGKGRARKRPSAKTIAFDRPISACKPSRLII